MSRVPKSVLRLPLEKRAEIAFKEAVAEVIAKAAERGGPVVYAPAFWRWIMLVIRHLPTFVFTKLNI